jgi:hypothetical protein
MGHPRFVEMRGLKKPKVLACQVAGLLGLSVEAEAGSVFAGAVFSEAAAPSDGAGLPLPSPEASLGLAEGLAP